MGCAPARGAVARLCASKGPTVLILGRFTQSAFLLRLLITECGDSASVLVDLPLDALLVMFAPRLDPLWRHPRRGRVLGWLVWEVGAEARIQRGMMTRTFSNVIK